MKTNRKILTLILAVIMLLSCMPASASFLEVLEETIIFDDLESYEVDFVPNGIKGWGTNVTQPITIQEINSNKVIRYMGTGGNGQFIYGPFTGKLWATTDILFPEDFPEDKYFRLTFNNQNNYAICNMQIFGDGRLRLSNIFNADGTKETITICDDIPIDGTWVNIRGYIDTYKQTIKIFVNGEQKGGEYDFCYKNGHDLSEAKAELAAFSDLKRIQFANVDAEGMSVYLDNFGMSYSRDLSTSTGYVEKNVIIDTYDDYSLPDTLTLPLEGGVEGDLSIINWTAQGYEIDFSNKQVGTYVYHGEVANSQRYVKYTVEIKERVVQSIDDVYDFAYQYSDYTLPETVTVTMDDGNKKDVSVLWDESQIDTSYVGVETVTGTIMQNGNEHTVTLRVSIGRYAVKEVDDIYVGVKIGESYTLPERVIAKVDDGTKQQVEVIWENTDVNTSMVGTYTYTGQIAGTLMKLKLQLTVYEENIDDENILDILMEYYENCLTEGRDRTRYGYSESDPHPLFAAGINRLTGEHSIWQFEGDKNVPLSDLASQTVLMKGLMGMSKITEDEKYSQAVKDVYRYYLENYVDENNHMLQWGGHMAINMKDYSVEKSMGMHELKDHYPLFDVMYEIDPLKTERYVKGIWKSHVKYPDTLEFSRHYNMSGTHNTQELDNIWNTIQNSFNKNTEPYFEGHSGLITFITAANDYIYAAAELFSLNGDEKALACALDMQNMYHKGRHDGSLDGKEPTGLIPFTFTALGQSIEQPYDVYSPLYTTSATGNRMGFNLYDLYEKLAPNNFYLNEFGMEYDSSIDITIYCYNPMVIFKVAEKTDEETKKDLINEAVKTLASFIKVKYDPYTNTGKPMIIDGTDLTGFVRKRTGYTGNIGKTFEPWVIDADYILAFIRGYINSMQYDDTEMQQNAEIIWGAVRNIFEYYGIGEVGETPGVNMELNYDTDCEEPFVLISLCEAYNKFAIPEYLDIARIVANNIINNRFIDGYFYTKDNMLNANFNTEEPYALVYFLATTKGIAQNIPEHFGSRGYFQFEWWDEILSENRKLFSTKLWNLTMASEILAEAIELDIAEAEVEVGEKLALSASIEPENTEDQSVEWQSSDENICIVDEDGVVTALSPGIAQITATAVSGGCETTALIKVR